MAGRDKILTEEVIKKIADAIYLGATKNLAADYAGISISSIMNWQKLGEEEKERIDTGKKPRESYALYLQFLQSITAAQADLGIELLQEIQEARQKQDVSSTWRLLTSKYREFGTAQAVALQNPDGSALEIIVKYADSKRDNTDAA